MPAPKIWLPVQTGKTYTKWLWHLLKQKYVYLRPIEKENIPAQRPG